MCRSVKHKYTCRHATIVRLSTCRGTKGIISRRSGVFRTACNGRPDLFIKLNRVCGQCTRDSLVRAYMQPVYVAKAEYHGSESFPALKELELAEKEYKEKLANLGEMVPPAPTNEAFEAAQAKIACPKHQEKKVGPSPLKKEVIVDESLDGLSDKLGKLQFDDEEN